MTTEEKILNLIRSTEPLRSLHYEHFRFIYDAADRALHISFNPDEEADGSFFIEPNETVIDAGDIVVHTAKGIVVGFSVLDTDLGQNENAS
ncbi:MAG: hypothetical protein IAF08_10450 [Rhizobacter sp.]|nr:hypothetical protein [Chlorobiales bacterium]